MKLNQVGVHFAFNNQHEMFGDFSMVNLCIQKDLFPAGESLFEIFSMRMASVQWRDANAKATKVHNINCEITIMVVIITVLIKYLAKGACDQALVKLYVVNGAKISKLASYSIG